MRLQAGLLMALWLAGLLVWAGMGLMAQTQGYALLSTGLMLILTGWLAWRGWHDTPRGTLCWDGQYWIWRPANLQIEYQACDVSVSMDLQKILLLRVKYSGHGQQKLWWLWAAQKHQAERWLDLRRAVHAHTRESREH